MITKRLVLSDTSPAASGTVAGTATIGKLNIFDSIQVVAVLTGATGGTLDVYIQSSADGTTWTDYAHFTQLAAGASAVTKSFTVSRGGQQTTITAVGQGTSPALSAGSVLGGEFGDQWRFCFAAGAGTSAGATQTVTVIGTRLA